MAALCHNPPKEIKKSSKKIIKDTDIVTKLNCFGHIHLHVIWKYLARLTQSCGIEWTFVHFTKIFQ